ncbi:hypothetical protein [Undibacterium rugosum]|uniref:hypothetical protein n=1 Tax=Undibacterium rugosum TaxID=2762291 RepID=UPI00164BC874|nr:hypothetical protein [Undibacterium rugosum]
MIKESGLTFFSHLIMPQLCDAEAKKQPKWCKEFQYKNQLLAYAPNIERLSSRENSKFRSIFRTPNTPSAMTRGGKPGLQSAARQEIAARLENQATSPHWAR